VLETQSIVLNGDSVFNVTNSSGSGINGLFKNLGTTTESGGSRSITKTGPGTLILAGDNSYTGSTSILVGTLRVEKLFSGPVEKFLFAEFTTGNLLVKFSSNPVVGESYKLLPGSTQQNFNTVTLLDNADNIIPELVGSYNSSNSTLSIS
jgi:fibronectin-binding autotransporter adhesin